MGQRRITLKDIAEKTGYSVNTVSRALKDQEDISDSTKQIIRDAAKQLGYVVDAVAGSLRSGSTKTIAVIVGDLSNPFFGALVRSVEFAAERQGYSIIIFNTNENSRRERKAILSAYSKRVDGILLCPVQEDRENLLLLEQIGIPFVLFGRHFGDRKADAVYWDDVKAGELAARYLIRQGHINILFLGGAPHISSAGERLHGYREAHRKAGLAIKKELVRVAGITTGDCAQELEQVLRERVPFTAVVAFSDLMAYEILRTLQGHSGFAWTQIPVVSFDNIQKTLQLPLSIPSVGCIGNPAEAAVSLLLEKISWRGERLPKQIVLDVELNCCGSHP